MGICLKTIEKHFASSWDHFGTTHCILLLKLSKKRKIYYYRPLDSQGFLATPSIHVYITNMCYLRRWEAVTQESDLTLAADVKLKIENIKNV